ncbi:unknown [Fusobacterium nucleatum subsp. nucleatum ATCC 25586]|uniref:Uncharacterized protein n=1 Tax=Fusobacterium nucleatum subsp. nucleatum (strain ATCC 25586 / DSM 15643 / BCRC 10681 / CIP 101130 / JCM 8532 / KCTC 2640 / LMG 13131 / VPI 4355) TaxID=190304 RepID=Q8RGY1_FUSNN|nr:unknown [Fusobacterium nucleatum subsp. nucleatum ATCC 25586]
MLSFVICFSSLHPHLLYFCYSIQILLYSISRRFTKEILSTNIIFLKFLIFYIFSIISINLSL